MPSPDERDLTERVGRFKDRLWADTTPAGELRDDVMGLLALAASPALAGCAKRVCAEMCVLSVCERIDDVGYAPDIIDACERAAPHVDDASFCGGCVRRHRVRALINLGRLDEADALASRGVAAAEAGRDRGDARAQGIALVLESRARTERALVAVERGDADAVDAQLEHPVCQLVARASASEGIFRRILLVRLHILRGAASVAAIGAAALLRGRPGALHPAVAAVYAARGAADLGDWPASASLAGAAATIAAALGATRVAVNADILAARAARRLGLADVAERHARAAQRNERALRSRELAPAVQAVLAT